MTGSTARWIAGLATPYRPLVALSLGAGVVSGLLTTVVPLLLGQATDLVFAHVVDIPALATVLAVALAMYLGAALLGFVQQRVATRVVQRIAFDLRERVQAKLSRLPVGFFDREPTGELLGRMTTDVDNLQQVLEGTLSQLISALVGALAVIVLMTTVSPLLAIIIVVTVPVSFVIAAKMAGRAKPRFVEQFAATGSLTSHVEETYTGHALVRSFGRRDLVVDQFERHNSAAAAASFRAQATVGMIEPALIFAANIGYVLVAVVGILRVAAGAVSLGGVQALMFYTALFNNQSAQIGGIVGRLGSAVASADRVLALLNEPEQTADSAAVPPAARGHVEFSHVHFRYAPDVPLIEDLSLTVQPGQTVAIVGETGAGKTTLGNLLMRFYDLNAGRILLDGIDIATMPRDTLRARTGLVLQDPWLFEGTVADNIAYGRPGASRADVIAAARATRVDHFVRTLPDGYDTVLTESASLSAGERQLITVARAFIADPALLILDEATASVDTRTELLIQRAVTSLRRSRTSFVIAHRLSTIRDADLILVMSAGAIVERGDHDTLLAAGGHYARLYAAQFAATEPAPLTAG